MWKEVIEATRRALRMAEDVHQNRTDLKELQKDFAGLTHKWELEALQIRHETALQQRETALQLQAMQARLDRQDDEIRRLREDLQQSREREDTMRRLFLAEVENHLLKSNRQLPPAADGGN